MKTLLYICFLIVAAHGYSQSPQSIPSPDITGHSLIDRIDEITSVPAYDTSAEAMAGGKLHKVGGDSLYTRIVDLGDEALPYLLEKIQDSTPTNIPIPCTDHTLTVGAIAYMLYDDIQPVPIYAALGMQFCLISGLTCEYSYPVGFLDYLMGNPTEVHERLDAWQKTKGKKRKRRR